MPGFYYTSDDIIESVKRRAIIPENQGTFQKEDFLAFATEEMNMGIVPTVLRVHEDYFLYTEEILLETNKVRYDIPYRAIGNKLREVSFKDLNGNIYEMTRIGVGELPFYNGPANFNRTYAYYISNNQICLVPDDLTYAGDSYLRITYYIRPNSLVLLEKVALISDINRTTGVISFSNIPSEFTSSSIYDFIQVKSPHKCLGIEKTPLSIVNTLTETTMTFDLADIPDDLEINDHVALATQSAIPQIPSDLHVMLAHRVAARCLEALGDAEGLQNANLKLAELEQQANTLIDNRVEDAPLKIVNRHAILRRGYYSRRFRFRG